MYKLFGVKPLFTTLYHQGSNGRIERFLSTLKASLKKLCTDIPRKWHRYLVQTVFAHREMLCERTVISPFDLLDGRIVKSPLTILRDLWEDKNVIAQGRTAFQYIIDLNEHLLILLKLLPRIPLSVPLDKRPIFT